jgi:hypothetical protein
MMIYGVAANVREIKGVGSRMQSCELRRASAKEGRTFIRIPAYVVQPGHVPVWPPGLQLRESRHPTRQTAQIMHRPVGTDRGAQANSEINPSSRFVVTYMCSILLYKSCRPFFQGCGELDVLFVSFEKRLDARSEGLIICRADRMSGLDTSGGDAHLSASRLRRHPSGRAPRFRACRGPRLGCLIPSPGGRFRTRTGSCFRRRAGRLG